MSYLQLAKRAMQQKDVGLVLDTAPLPEDLPADWSVWYEERLGIMEHLGKVPLEYLEARALTCTLNAMRAAGVAIPTRGSRRP